MRSYTLCISNQKGGVGKTTTAVNLAAGLALEGAETLLIDLDPQGNATSGLGIDPGAHRRGVYRALIGVGEIHELCVPAPNVEGLSVLPSNQDLYGAEIELVDAVKREYRLKEAIARSTLSPRFIIIDCPPSLGLLTINALTCADAALIPLQCEYYALEGLSQLTRTIELIRRNLNPTLSIEGILLTMFDKRTNLSHQVADEVRSFFGEQVFDVVIPRNIRLSESPSYGKSIHHYDRSSRGARAYRKLAQTIIQKHPLQESP